MQFNMVVCGLDSVDARRWMSATLVNLVDPDVPESLKPLIDGGTEGQWVPCGVCTTAKGLKLNDFDFVKYRLQGPSACDAPDDHIVLRMQPRHAHAADRVPDLHHRQHASSSRALHRVGLHPRVAPHFHG